MKGYCAWPCCRDCGSVKNLVLITASYASILH